MKQVAESWIRLMPLFKDGEDGDEQVGWQLVIDVNNDEYWSIDNNQDGKVTFVIYIRDSMTAQLNPVPIYFVTGSDEEPEPKELIDARAGWMRKIVGFKSEGKWEVTDYGKINE